MEETKVIQFRATTTIKIEYIEMIIQRCNTSKIIQKVYDVNSYPYTKFYKTPLLQHGKGESRSTRRIDYLNAIMTLDIETTNITNIKQSFCYIWQVCLNNVCIIGRSLPDLKRFFDRLTKTLDDKTRILCFVHNLSFEFHNLREIIPFEDVFSTDKRRVVKARYKNIEFRCSYILTNLSLDAMLKKYKVNALKTTLNYEKIRYPWSHLNADETKYCLHDVIGLYQAIKALLKSEGDTLYTLPLTSTGFTRRDVRNAFYKQSRLEKLQEAIPDFPLFEELYEAFRGGNTHANRWISGKIIKSADYGLIHSYDRASSYPDVLINKKFPWKFRKYRGKVENALKKGFAILTRVHITNLTLKNKWSGCPYIPISKTRNLSSNRLEDNGRLLTAESFDITVTDIDLKIIKNMYNFNATYTDTYISVYEELPSQIKKVILTYFKGKTELKGIAEREEDYNKFKNRFNAIYGLMVQSPAKQNIDYLEDEMEIFQYSTEQTLEEIYTQNCKKIFLLYQWGVWCTAHARDELQDIINIVEKTKGAQFLYTDTDSVKFTGNVDFSEYNDMHMEQSRKNHAVATDSKGNERYLGILEQEADITEFITHGAKKYAYTTEDSELHLTCAGVSKKKGKEELGSIKWFKDGFIFGESAGLEALYNDRPFNRYYNTEGKKIYLYSNIYLGKSTYTVSKNVKYKELLAKLPYIDYT